MSANSQYRVFPRQVNLQPVPQVESIKLDEREREGVKGLGGGAGFILFMVAFGTAVSLIALNGSDSTSAVLLCLLPAFLAVILLRWAIRASRIAEKERVKAQQTKQRIDSANKAEITRAESEAQAVTMDLIKVRDSSSSLASELPQHLNGAIIWLRQAEHEYKDNAFGPFWDAVEGSAQQLAAFNNIADQIARLADRYYRGLSGKAHTFPPFPANNTNIPSPSSVVDELRRVVRMGQTNFQFANIWEHRRTREVMIAGFGTLGEAVNNIGSVVERSLFSLEQTISSDVAKVVQAEIKTRDSLDKRLLEQNRMLDNVQHHREPSISDRPSR